MPEKPQYLAEIKITRLDPSQERIETKVRANDLDGLKHKISTILGTMEEGVDL